MMKVKDLMNTETKFIDANNTAQEAAKILRDFNVGTLLVQSNSKENGIVTDRDITIRLVAEGKDPKTTMIKDIMTKEIFTCHEHETLEQASWKMMDNHVRRLAVINDSNDIVGVLSIDDIAIGNDDNYFTGEVLNKIIKAN